VRARFSHDELGHLQAPGQVRSLIGSRDPAFADHFLEPDDVRAQLADDVGDPVEITAAVQSDAPVDVVAHDREMSHAASAW
jgi:hypothetical protein